MTHDDLSWFAIAKYKNEKYIIFLNKYVKLVIDNSSYDANRFF